MVEKSSRSLDTLSASQIASLVKAGEVSAREVAQAALDAIEQREDAVHAFLEITPEMALEKADSIDAARAAGEELPPMAGVPVAFKDNMHLVGTRCTCASHMLENYQSVEYVSPTRPAVWGAFRYDRESNGESP